MLVFKNTESLQCILKDTAIFTVRDHYLSNSYTVPISKYTDIVYFFDNVVLNSRTKLFTPYFSRQCNEIINCLPDSGGLKVFELAPPPYLKSVDPPWIMLIASLEDLSKVFQEIGITHSYITPSYVNINFPWFRRIERQSPGGILKNIAKFP